MPDFQIIWERSHKQGRDTIERRVYLLKDGTLDFAANIRGARGGFYPRTFPMTLNELREIHKAIMDATGKEVTFAI